MVAGALAGWLVVYFGANLWVGVLAAALAGAAFGLLHALLTVPLALSQHVAGLAITLFATSVSYYAYRVSFPNVTTPPTIQPFAEMTWLAIPVLSKQTPMTLLALVAVPVIAWILYRTPVGLAVRMVGENPAAAEGQGLDVNAVRTGAIVAGSALMGVAGAFLTLSAFNAFFNMVNGRGRPRRARAIRELVRAGALAGALVFALLGAAVAVAGGRRGRSVPDHLMLPYVLSILALVLVAPRQCPQALMSPTSKAALSRSGATDFAFRVANSQLAVRRGGSLGSTFRAAGGLREGHTCTEQVVGQQVGIDKWRPTSRRG
jgi:simple sugar transport system permease protein